MDGMQQFIGKLIPNYGAKLPQATVRKATSPQCERQNFIAKTGQDQIEKRSDTTSPIEVGFGLNAASATILPDPGS
jgi:hypothetical protein